MLLLLFLLLNGSFALQLSKDAAKCLKSPIGMETNKFPAAQLKASSYRPKKEPNCGRFNLKGLVGCSAGAWVAAVNDKSQWFQFDFIEPSFVVDIKIQKRADKAQWIEKFFLYYSVDGQNWRPYAKRGQLFPYKFAGLDSSQDSKTVTLDEPLYARYLRINPQQWKGSIALRADVSLCTVGTLGPCAPGLIKCDPLTKCTWPNKQVWEAKCSACPAGYEGSGETSCTDINECERGNGGCDRRTTCTNTKGSRKCSDCPEGYTGDGGQLGGCQDVDECLVNNGGCDALVKCINQPGTRLCGQCPLGYSGNGEDGCKDIDECAKANGGCDPLTSCMNIPGGRTCGPCPPGYEGTGANGCLDVDECMDKKTSGCDPNVECINTPGSRICGRCPPGWLGTGATKCYNPEDLKLKTANGTSMTPEDLAKIAGEKAASKTAKNIMRNAKKREARLAEERREDEALQQAQDLNDALQDLVWEADGAKARREGLQQAALDVHRQIVSETAKMRTADIYRDANDQVKRTFHEAFTQYSPLTDNRLALNKHHVVSRVVSDWSKPSEDAE